MLITQNNSQTSNFLSLKYHYDNLKITVTILKISVMNTLVFKHLINSLKLFIS